MRLWRLDTMIKRISQHYIDMHHTGEFYIMVKRWIVLLGLLTLGVMPAAAQDVTPVPPEAAREQQWILEMVDA